MTHVRARLLAAVAAPLLLLHPAPASCRAAAAAPPAMAARLGHISIEVTGQGTPVFLIPGLASPRETWAGVLPDLALHHRVYLVQVNGFAGDAPGANLTPGILNGVVADLHGYIAANRLQGAAVVGHSLGGLAALMLARAHPGDAGRLMIVDSLPYIGEIFVPGATVAMLQPRAAAMRDGIAASYGKPADPALAEATAARLAATPDARGKVKGWAMAADPRVTAEAMYEDLTTDLRPDMAAIATPITLVYPWGGAGPSKEQADALYRHAYAAAPHMSYVDIADSAHFVMLDQPTAFAAALKAFADAP